MDWVERTNMAVAKTFVGRHFRLEFSGHKDQRRGSRFLTEVNAGLATFFAMAYIISVNAQIVSRSGGTCVCESTTDPTCINDERYLECVQDINKDLVTATAAITAFSSMAMGIFTNLPVALGPGMGLNVYFTYQVVGFHGTGNLSYQSALMVVFVQGLVFFLISLLGLRQWLGRAIPASLKMAAAAGIGLYITLIGLTYSAGIGAITGGRSDPLTLGGCTPDLIDPVSGMCKSGQLRNPTMWLGIFAGGIFTAFLMLYRVKGAIIFGILLVSIASWPRGTPVTTFPYTPLGDSSFDFFKQVVTFHPIKHIFGVIDWDITSGETVQFLVALITFLYVDILDLTGTLYSMAKFCGALNEETQDFEGSSEAYIVDAVSISLGAFVGCPPITAFIESGAGIAEGGKTGLTACVTGLCFFVSIFFAPIFASIPPWATGCTLILVGSMMARAVVDINWGYVGDAVPAFLTLAIMPFTYSIAYGLVVGIVTYMLLNGSAWILYKLSSGRIVPHEYDSADPWSATSKDGFAPGWLRRLCGGKRDFWREQKTNGDIDMSNIVKATGKDLGCDDASRMSEDLVSSTEPSSPLFPTSQQNLTNWEVRPSLARSQAQLGSQETIVGRCRRCTQ